MLYKYLKGLAKSRSARKMVHLRCLVHYSGLIPECKFCGLVDVRFLTLDHIDNNGSESRRIHGRGSSYYKYLIKTGFPDNLRVLCSHCNNSVKRIQYKMCYTNS